MNNLVSAGTAASARAFTVNPRVRVRDLIKELRAQYKRASEVELAKRLVDVLEDDHDALLMAAQFIVHVVKGEAARSRRRAGGASHHAEHRVAVKTQAAKLAERVKATLVLDMMIDGTALRFHTGASIARLGAGFIRLAEHVPADAYVGECVTEAEAASLMGAAV
jgi:hypothetical protein